MEAEARSKAEVIRTKKKLEADIQELEAALDHISRVKVIDSISQTELDGI